MFSYRYVIRQSQYVGKRLFTAQTARQGLAKENLNRKFSAEAAIATTPCQDSLVKDAIKKMLDQRDHVLDETRVIEDHELERRFRHFQNIYEEAELCISDLKEAENFEEENQCASGAVETAFSAYVDLLEDMRHANEEQLELYNDKRLENANNLKKLRQELDKLSQSCLLPDKAQ